MAWKYSATPNFSGAAVNSSADLTIWKSYRRILSSPFYKVYRLCETTGDFAIKLAGAVGRTFQNIWYYTFSEGFEKLKDALRNISELKRSGFVRGEFSIMRGILHVGRKWSRFIEHAAGSYIEGGLLFGLSYTGRLMKNSASRFWCRHSRVFNYVAPAAGIAALGLTIYLWSGVTLAVSVSYNGRQVGLVASEKIYQEAARSVETEVSDASGETFALTKAPVYQLRLATRSQLLDSNSIYNNLLCASGSEVGEGYGLYVDNRFVGANSDSSSIQTMLDSILGSFKADKSVSRVEFAQDVKIKKGIFPTSALKSVDSMKEVLTASASNSQTYTVKRGDSPLMVANMFHISLNQLYAMNTSVETDGLSQGEDIRVGSGDITLSVKYTRQETTTQSIPFQVVTRQSDRYAKGYKKITRPGQNGVMKVVSEVTYVGNKAVGAKVLSTSLLQAPVNQKETVGSDSSDSSGSGGDSFSYSGGYSGSGGLIDYASNYLGSRYRSGGASPSGFDCSGFTMYVFSKYGISLPHSAAAQSHYGSRVTNLQPGDLVFFSTHGSSSGISHVGIYIGGGDFINAENYGSGVTIDSLNTAYWSRTLVSARRVLK